MNTIVNQEQQTNGGTVAGWRQAYTDVTNGLYQITYELKLSEGVVAELRDERDNMEQERDYMEQERVNMEQERDYMEEERDDLQDQVDDWQEKHTDLEDEIETLCNKLKLARHDARTWTDAYAGIKARLDLASGQAARAPRKKTPPPVAPRKKSC